MPTIFIIGDSLSATKFNSKKPETGWGELLHRYVPNHYVIDNHAVNGRSTKSFIDEGLFDTVKTLWKPHDILLIQFGHNDQKKEDPSRYTDPFGSYTDNLSYFIIQAKLATVKPILISSITRRIFIDKGILDGHTLGDYPEAMHLVAVKHNVAFVDMFQTSQVIVASLGVEQSKNLYLHLDPKAHTNYPDGIIDNTHLNEHGADVMASIIGLSIAPYLT